MVENDINALSTGSSESDALITGGPTHLQMVEGTLATGAIDVDAASVPTHLQMVEGALNPSDASAINDSQADDRLYYAGGTAAAPQATDPANAGAHLQRLERDLNLGAGTGPTAFEDHSGIGPVLEGGDVDVSGSTTVEPSVNWDGATPTDQ
jgi:hypothetical protein